MSDFTDEEREHLEILREVLARTGYEGDERPERTLTPDELGAVERMTAALASLSLEVAKAEAERFFEIFYCSSHPCYCGRGRRRTAWERLYVSTAEPTQ